VSPGSLVIVLSSYNGSRFIAEQIESIRRQTLSDWTLIVRDDGSSDDTPAVVQSIAALDPRIKLLNDSQGNLGPAASFGLLLERARDSGARYVALADQDDVWSAEKLSREVELLRSRERVLGNTVPLLVHSDLVVVGENLAVIHPSFLTFQGLRHQPEWPLGTLLVQNFVTGCTAVINRALLEAAIPVPAVIMHDWWLALCAAALGEVAYLPDATVRYRQHESNVQGSRGWKSAVSHSLRRPLAWWSGSALMLQRAVRQADELRLRVQREEARTPRAARSLQLLREFCSAFTGGGALTRLRTVYRHRIRPRTLLPYPVPFYLRVVAWRLPARSAAEKAAA
jgi:glycosyltransferase involved in cell wall biosynthesis